MSTTSQRTRAAVPPSSVTLRELRSRGRLRAALALLGPAFVASVAYVDPGNFATDFAAGARDRYQLVWVVIVANVMAILIQYLSAKTGLATGRSLPGLCRERFGRRTNVVLWFQAEAVAMATDLAEFVGAALGLRILFGMALLPAGLVTAVISFAILAGQRRGYRRFELAIAALLALVAAGFLYLLVISHQEYRQIAGGLAPSLGGAGALGLAVGIIGATVMPHVVYLHSALQGNRVGAAGDAEQRTLLRFSTWDCVIGLGAAGLVNLAMLCVAASLTRAPVPAGLAGGNLVSTQAALSRLIGGGAGLAFAAALLASGLSSSSVGTYAGQVAAAGFLDWKIPLFARRLLTMLPALIVLAIASNTSAVLVDSQIVLSFGIPFALIPLVILSRDPAIMGHMVNRRVTTMIITGVSVAIIALNAALIASAV